MRTFYDLVEKRFCDRANYPADRVHQTQLEAWGYLGTEAVMRELAGYIRAAQARVANWKAGVWDYMRDGKCQQLVLDAGRSGVEAVATAFLGMRPPEMKGNALKGRPVTATCDGVWHAVVSGKGEGVVKAELSDLAVLTDGDILTDAWMNGHPTTNLLVCVEG